MKRKQPETSLEAWRSVKNTLMLSQHHSRILAALGELKEAIYERIAIHCDMEKNQISRRLLELERLGIIEKTGNTSLTLSGRKANMYRLTPPKKVVSASDCVQLSAFN